MDKQIDVEEAAEGFLRLDFSNEAAERYANGCVDIKDKDRWQACYCDFKAGAEWQSLQSK